MSNYDILKKVYKEFSIDLKGAKPSEEQLEAYPWDECIEDQVARYGDEETANKVCGAIKAGMKKVFAEGDSLESACWPGYEAIGLKDGPNGLVPNCVPIKEEQSKQAFVIPGPEGDEDEKTYISRCISEIIGEYDQEGQAYAICKGKWDEPK